MARDDYHVIVYQILSYLYMQLKQGKDIDENIDIYNLDKCEITPKGIEYLTDNSTIEKAKRFMKDLKDILPFV